MAGPKKLKIGNHVYTVRWGVPGYDNQHEYLFGRTHTLTTRMEINDTVSLSQQRDTLVHEILHAVLADDSIELSDETEEALIRAVTPGLLGALRSNPALVSFLLSKET